jgi:hypothetical protein
MCYIYVVALEECVSNLVMLHVYSNSELREVHYVNQFVCNI